MGDRDRIAAGAQARPQRPPHVDAPPVAAALVAPRQPRRGRQLEPRHQPVEAGELVGLERVEALRRQHLLVTRHRQRNVDLAPGLVVARPRRRGRAAALDPGLAGGASGAAGPRIVARADRRRARIRELGPGLRTAAEDRGEDGVERGRVGAVLDEHRARRPVEAATALRSGQGERARERRRTLGGHRDPRRRAGAGRGAGERRQIEVDRLDRERRLAVRLSHRCARAGRGRPRGSPPDPRRT